MAENTKIAWCDSTFNPWIGCTRVGPGCDHCYAEAQDSRKRWGGTTHWGAGVARYRTSASNWAQPLKWNKAAAASGKVHRVFCASLADVFDNEVPDAWRADLFSLIAQTQSLSWLLVTKRVGNVARMVPYAWTVAFPKNARLLITVCNQEEANRDVPKLLALNCKNGVSYEPALGHVSWGALSVGTKGVLLDGFTGLHGGPINALPLPERYGRGIEWIIIGGESKQGEHEARPFNLAWASYTVQRCQDRWCPVFVKQLGSRPVYEFTPGCDAFPEYADRAGADPAEWPENLRIQEFPE